MSANEALYGGGGIAVVGASTSVLFENVRVVGNATGGGVYVEDAAVSFWNTTFAGNEAPVDGGSGLTVLGLGSVTMVGSIVWEDEPAVYVEAGANFVGSYGNVGSYDGVSDPTGTDGNLSEDPLFLDWTDDGADNDDFHLQSGSRVDGCGRSRFGVE